MTYKSPTQTITFDPKIQNQRAALTLANGLVYVAWASHDDLGSYHGWVASFKTNPLGLVSTYVDTPNGTQGGIWQAGHGLTVDAAGNLLFSSGNGSFGIDADGTVETGNSFVKLSPALKLLDYFTPMNSATLNSADQDLGSTGLLSIPGTTLLLSAGKQGRAYLVNSNSMGHFNASTDNVKQVFQAVHGVGTSHLHGGPVYWNSAEGPVIYLWGENDVLRAFSFDTVTQLLNTTPVATSTMTAPMISANGAMPGGFLSVSSNGTSNGIIWASTPYKGSALQATVPGVLHAFDAITLAELWSDKTNDLRDEIGNFAKNVPPIVANGKVFVPNFGVLGSADGSGSLNVYGLLNLIPNGTYTLKAVNSGLLLEVPGGSTQAATVLDQAGASGLSSQSWEVTNLGSNVIRLTNVQSGMDVDVSGASKALSAPVIQYPYHTAANQQWRVNQVKPGVYTLTNVNSGFLLDVSHASKASGAKMDQYPPNLSSNQSWTFQLTVAHRTCSVEDSVNLLTTLTATLERRPMNRYLRAHTNHIALGMSIFVAALCCQAQAAKKGHRVTRWWISAIFSRAKSTRNRESIMRAPWRPGKLSA